MKRFVTSYQRPDGLYSDTIDAVDSDHAQMLCDERGRGEIVDGVLWLQLSAAGRTESGVNELTASMAETYHDDEPPEAEEFDPT